MSPSFQPPPSMSTKNKERQPQPGNGNAQIHGRQLEPYFDASVGGMELEPVPDGKRKAKAKTPRKMHHRASPNQPKLNPHRGTPHVVNAAEQGYHSESGTAHYMTGSRNQSISGQDLNAYTAQRLDGINECTLHSDMKQNTATPTKQVYAGPNFLASPAASALPMPKAFVKSTPPAESPPSSKSLGPEFQLAISSPFKMNEGGCGSHGREGSPLDFLFHADKAEKLRKASHSASPLSAGKTPDVISPPARGSSDHGMRILQSSQKQRENQINKDKLCQEVDGEEDQSDNADSNEYVSGDSYKQRIDALRHESDSSLPVKVHTEGHDVSHEASTQALKELLFKPSKRQTPLQSSDSPPSSARSRKAISVDIKSNPHRSYPSAASPIRYESFAMPSQELRPIANREYSNVQSPAPATEGASSSDIEMMENNLRKVLNIRT